MNCLYYGDCLTIMRDMPENSIDLVYLDPPFNSNRDYSAIYKDETGLPLPDQVSAFQDTWSMDAERELAIRKMPILMRESGLDDEATEFLKAWMKTLRNGDGKLLAYISYMTERLLPLKRILKPTGSIYFHCDPTASHYIKVMMDAIFGYENFCNEIIWHYDGPQRPSRKKFGAKHDVILRYSASEKYYADADEIIPPQKVDAEGLKKYKKTSDGQYYYTTPRGDYTDKSIERLDKEGRIEYTSSGKVRVRYFLHSDDVGQWWRKKQRHDVWSDIVSLGHAGGNEKIGYSTQKPLDLLNRIIKASSKSGDVIFDPFCGCATTIEAAHELGRKWIGIDIAIHAIKRVAKVRLQDRLGLEEGKDFTITGVPHSLEGAHDMWDRDKFHFQKWAVEQVDGFVTSRKTGDGGIDGRLYFSLTQERDLKYSLQSMVLEVKGGKNINVNTVRDLRGVLERDDALMAGLIVMADLSPRKAANFAKEMAEAGHLEVGGVSYPKMQILSVPEILQGKRFHTPSIAKSKEQSEPNLPLG